MSLSCEYHPDREAHNKCEKCQKLLCVECKRTLHRTYSRGSSEHRRYYSVSYELCPECYYEEIIKSTNPKMCIIIFTIMAVMMSIMIGVTFGMDYMMNSFTSGLGGLPGFGFVIWPFALIPIFILGGASIAIFYYAKVYLPRKKEEIIAERDNWMASVGLELVETPRNISSGPQSGRSNVNTCPNCGEDLDPDDKFCSGCGTRLD